MYLKCMQPELKWFRDKGLDGFELPMGAMGRRTKAFNYYVLSKLMWDVNADTEAVMQDYFENVYGRFAGKMREIYQLVEDAQTDLHYFQNINKKYLIHEYDYTENAANLLGLACEKMERVFGEVEDEQIKGRMGRFKISLEYTNLQWQTVKMLVESDMAIENAYMAENEEQFNELLTKANRLIPKVKENRDRRNEMLAKHEGNGLLWDAVATGELCVFQDKHVDDRVEKLEKLNQYNFRTMPKIIWQIGFFDGTNKELGTDAYKFAQEAIYTVKADHGEDNWRNFTGRHLPTNQRHANSITIVFNIDEPGEYALTVGQLNTWQSKTIDVLLNGEKVGSYITAKDNQSKVHEVIFEIASVGENRLTLSTFDKGDAYSIDAVKLAKIRKKD